jgi:ferredoxin
MPRVRFHPMAKDLEVPDGTTLLSAARQAGLPIGASCDGDGICGACGLRIVAGAQMLSHERPLERSCRLANRVPDTHRLACLVRVHGDVEVRADYW